MRIAIITDQHFGARGDSTQCLDYYEKFYNNVFFPKLEENDIGTVYILGDTFDRRKYVNFNTLARAKKMFFDKLDERDIRVVMIAGNHDTYYKNTNDVNSPDLLLCEYTNIAIIDRPTTVTEDGTDICMLPWICADNYEDTMNTISSTKAEVCMGHLEIAGFQMYRGAESHDGMDRSTFKKFSKVFSGHYHHKSEDDNVFYLGNPYELTWQDYNDPRGFHLFDLETYELEFIQNPYTMFYRYEYDDTNLNVLEFDYSVFTNNYVKIVVVNKTNLYSFDMFINNVYKNNPLDVKIIEDFSEFNNGEVDETINLEDTSSVLTNYIDSINTDVDKDKVKTFMKTLYTEALNYEST